MRSETGVGFLVACWYRIRRGFGFKFGKQDWTQTQEN